MAETRSIARALRFAGYGLEFSGAEEVLRTYQKVPLDLSHHSTKPLHQYSLKAMATAKWQRKRQLGLRRRLDQNRNIAGMVRSDHGRKVSALFALSRKANYQEADIGEMLARFDVSRFEDLSRESASQLIGHLQTQVAA